MLIEAAAVLGLAAVVGLAAVWFGRRMLAPTIQRALDRADEDDDTGD